MVFTQIIHAACTRSIIVPASPLGVLIEISDSGGVSGIYPDLLREYGKKMGCEFIFPVVPRARAELMMQTGTADLLIGSIQVPERDVWGRFLPMLGTEWMLISNRTDVPPQSVQELLNKPNIVVNAVKSFNYGPAYLAMLARLDKLNKLEYVNDSQTIIRKMLIGRVDYAFMPSTVFAGTLVEMGIKDSVRQQIHYTRLQDIPASVAGLYLSKSISEIDAIQIESILIQIRHDHVLLTRLKEVFMPAEMVSNFELPAIGKVRSKIVGANQH